MDIGSIAVTGANGQVGRALVKALSGRAREVACLVRRKSEPGGCRQVTDWMHADQALEALSQAEEVVHLAGTLNPKGHDYESANIATTRRVVAGIDPDTTRRLIFLSYVGAAEDSPNAYLSSKARAERLLTDTGVPCTVLRCTHIIGPPESPGPTAGSLRRSGGKTVAVLGSGRQRVAPIYLGDVVAAVLAALSSDTSGTFDLAGPESMTMDELVRLLNPEGGLRISHVPWPAAQLLRFVGPKLPAALIDIMRKDSLGKEDAAAEALGISLTPVSDVWG